METEEPAPVLTLKERIAALKIAQETANNPAPKARQPIFNASKSKPPPPPLPKRTSTGLAAAGGASQPVRRALGDRSATADTVAPARISNGAPPSLPPRRAQPAVEEAAPTLPPRRPPAPRASSSPLTSGRLSLANSPAPSLSSLSGRRPQGQIEDGGRGTLSSAAMAPPKDFPRPDTTLSAPKLPTRPQSNQARPFHAEALPSPPQRRPGRDDQGSHTPPPLPPNRPQQQPQAVTSPRPANPVNQPPEPSLVQLYANTFDSVVINSGKPSFVDFYAPFCKYCKELDPIYEELAAKYQDQHITIAKIDSHTEKAIGERYQVNGWPTLYFFDGAGSPPVKFEWKRDMEWLSIFIDEQLSTLPTHLTNQPASLVVHLNATTFDGTVLHSGKPAFVDFYAPFCKYCRELNPIYRELAAKYQDQYITIAKIDSYTQKVIGERYDVQSWPTLYFFDGSGGPPVKYEWQRNMEWMSRFVDEQMKLLPAATYAAPPPVPAGSRPVF